MSRRAIFSLLIALTGALAATAAPLGTEVKNTRFQPGRSLKPTVLKPAGQAVLRPSVHRVEPGAARITPVVLSPARATVLRPAASKVSPAESGRRP
jgi:hypothetical protein